ncbi:hypothetical protein BD626DRAFT_20426 [Schizophyllum amplum]|uniref:Uncharacterized protein n=1 Tax=Schizophyllum amplum TaxID=97359 RepID=A0A550CYP3_9AGAR|nr:hypothetical protein BD626DRAFT_20426 [Auriculariopsis ampla]
MSWDRPRTHHRCGACFYAASLYCFLPPFPCHSASFAYASSFSPTCVLYILPIACVSCSSSSCSLLSMLKVRPHCSVLDDACLRRRLGTFDCPALPSSDLSCQLLARRILPSLLPLCFLHRCQWFFLDITRDGFVSSRSIEGSSCCTNA